MENTKSTFCLCCEKEFEPGDPARFDLVDLEFCDDCVASVAKETPWVRPSYGRPE